MVVAGEASGDSHAAHLVDALRKQSPADTFEFFGCTGDKLRAAGVETVVPADDLAIIGLLEIAKCLPMFWRVFRQLKKVAIERKPDAVILVDFPDFNLKLAKALKKEGIKVIYFVSPQLWAWRSYRRRSIAKYVDLLLTILPFEEKWYSDRGIHNVVFVGHPMVGKVRPSMTKEIFCRLHNLSADQPIVTILAGSRRKEITKILPPILDGVEILHQQDPSIQFVVAVAPTRSVSETKEIVAATPKRNLPALTIVEGQTYEAVASSDAAIVASGTATLETGLLNTPLVIVYKVSSHNWHLLRHFVSVAHYGLINLIAGDRLATELIQNDCSGRNIAGEIVKLLDPLNNRTFRDRLAKIAASLGDGGASEKAAVEILKVIR